MKTMSLCRYALSGTVAAILAGCGGGSATNAIGTVPAVPATVDVYTHHKTFHYTGNRQSFIVPENVKRLSVDLRGGMGGGPESTGGGRPGRVEAVISVTPKEVLYVFVGGPGSGQSGGFNGGGNGGSADYCECNGYGGGGASDVRKDNYKLSNRILIAGGGGGSGGTGDEYYDVGGTGGAGGGKEAAAGSAGTGDGAPGGGGNGGNQYNGGAGGSGGSQGSGYSGIAGALGVGGDGGGIGSSNGAGGGGGGSGYYGGGGGGAGAGSGSSSGDPEAGGGGGGGSSWVEFNAIKYRLWRGWHTTNPDGIVVISWNT